MSKILTQNGSWYEIFQYDTIIYFSSLDPNYKGRFDFPSNDIKYICNKACLNCTKLTLINIANQIESIGDLAFAGCINLLALTMPDNLKVLGENVINNCNKLCLVKCPPEFSQKLLNSNFKHIKNTDYYLNTTLYCKNQSILNLEDKKIVYEILKSLPKFKTNDLELNNICKLISATKEASMN